MTSSSHERVLNVAVHESEFPETHVREMAEALRERRLPGKWLYHTPSQARLWLAYHQAYSPSRADAAMAPLYREAFAAALDAMGEEEMELVGLGSGGGHKDCELLALAPAAASVPVKKRERGGPARAPAYVPVDASQALVLEAALHVARRFPQLPVRPLVADLAAAPDLTRWLEDSAETQPSRLFTCFGMMPNMDAAAFPAWLRGLLDDGAQILISANLSPGGMKADQARILPQYDNPPARLWYTAALEALGIEAAAVELHISARPSNETGASGDAAWQVVVEAELSRDLSLNVFDAEFSFAAGERLRVFHSNRFTAEAFHELLANARLHTHQQWLHGSGEEGIFLCGAGRE